MLVRNVGVLDTLLASLRSSFPGENNSMAFEKYTALSPPAPKPKPHIKFVRTIIQFTEDGLKHLGEAARKLSTASHVHLWHDKETSQIAITPAEEGDRDVFMLKDGKIHAKAFWQFAGISTPIKQHDQYVEPHDDGVKLKVGHTGTKAAATEAAPKPRKPRVKRTADPDRPGFNTDGTKRGGRKKAFGECW